MTAPSEKKPRSLKPATQLVHGGTLRSPFGETSEALFLTQGFVYDTAEAAEARFKGEDPGFIYSRFSNPTSPCSSAAWRARRRGSGARHRHRHGRRHRRPARASSRPAITWSRRAPCSAPAATWSRTCCRASASPPLWSTARSRAMAQAVRPNTKTLLSGELRPIRRSKL